jgi:bacterioferritin-associated ferredoxin
MILVFIRSKQHILGDSMSDNPLKQYFRTPALYMTLPSGVDYYSTDIVEYPENGELPVFPMTNADEIAVRNPDGMFNGASMVTVIKSCVPAIKNPWLLNNIDVEAVVVALRAASVDETLDITSQCPKCNEESSFGINLTNLLNQKVNIDYSSPFETGDLKIYFRPLTYKEMTANGIRQFDVQRVIAQLENVPDEVERAKIVSESVTKLNSLTTDIIVQTIEKIVTPEATVTNKEHIHEFLKETDSKTSKAVRDYGVKLRETNDTKPIKLKCSKCEHQYQQPLILNFADFFA